MTLVELLVVVAIVGVLLSFVGGFFGLQARVSRDQQVRSELETASRTIGDLIAQDFQLVGSRAAAFPDGRGAAANAVAANVSINSNCFFDSADCLDVSPISIGEVFVGRWTLTYMSSLWLTEPLATENFDAQLAAACRRVEYLFEDGRLLRSDRSCSDPVLDLAAVPDPFAYEVASGVQLVDFEFLCAVEGTAIVDAEDAVQDFPEGCYDFDGSFVRSVSIFLEIRSMRRPDLPPLEYEIAAPTPNLRPPFSFITGDQ